MHAISSIDPSHHTPLPADELTAWLRLMLTPGVGNATARRLLAAFGPPAAVFRQSPVTLATLVGEPVGGALLSPPEALAQALARYQNWINPAQQRHLLSLGDPAYPRRLLNMADPPLLLHVHGDWRVLHHPHGLAVVGSRNPSPQGRANAHGFARQLSASGLCVVSGLALGVDGAAHEGALAAGGPTVAVVGTGLDRVYPRQHHGLAQRIVVQGAMLSEYLLGTPPLAANFPQRNRLIAGLSLGTLVIEAAVKSGSLITARLASEMGCEVFAIPGSIHAAQAKGCHALIRQGAKLVESAQDVLEELQLDLPQPTDTWPDGGHAASVSRDFGTETDSECDPLLRALGYDPVGFDVLQNRCGWPTAQLQTRLLELELQGHVGRMPGGLLQRLARA